MWHRSWFMLFYDECLFYVYDLYDICDYEMESDDAILLDSEYI